MAVERQELHCHACDRYVQFDLDMSLDGNHVLRCPNCGHEHCRVVRRGRITGDRWDSRNQTFYVSNTSTNATILSTYTTASTSSPYLYMSWLQTTAS